MPDKAMFGRYWPGTSPVHRMDPRAKLLLSLALMVATFCAQNYAGLAVCAAFVVGFYAVAGIPLGQAFRSIGPLLFIVVVTALLNVFFVQGGTVYFQWWIFCISEAGIASAAFIACRLLLLLLGVSLLTLTTTALDITDAFEYLLKPFARIGLPAHELAMMMGIALRFLPQFAFELTTVYRAQISRGATFAGSLKGRARMLSLHDGPAVHERVPPCGDAVGGHGGALLPRGARPHAAASLGVLPARRGRRGGHGGAVRPRHRHELPATVSGHDTETVARQAPAEGSTAKAHRRRLPSDSMTGARRKRPQKEPENGARQAPAEAQHA